MLLIILRFDDEAMEKLLYPVLLVMLLYAVASMYMPRELVLFPMLLWILLWSDEVILIPCRLVLVPLLLLMKLLSELPT